MNESPICIAEYSWLAIPGHALYPEQVAIESDLLIFKCHIYIYFIITSGAMKTENSKGIQKKLINTDILYYRSVIELHHMIRI